MGIGTQKRIEHFCDEKIFLTTFIPFQYKCNIESLNPKNKVHKSVMDRLKKYGLFKPLGSPLKGGKDMDKDKEKELDKDKEIGKNLTDGIPQGAIDFLKDGSMKPIDFFTEFPCHELTEPATKVIKETQLAINPGTKREPDKYQILTIKKYLLLGGSEDDLFKSIKGAKLKDERSKKPFEIPNLTAEYITDPKNQARLIASWDMGQAEENQNTTGNSEERTYEVETWYG